MARLRGRSKLILEQAEQRLREAEMKLENRRSAATAAIHDLETEQAVVNAIRIGYDALRQSLTNPRQPSKSVGTTAVPKRVYERCARCDKTKGHRFHKDNSDDGYHEFQRPSRQLVDVSGTGPSITPLPAGVSDIDDDTQAAVGGRS